MGEQKRVVVTGVGIFTALGKNKEEVLDQMKKSVTGIKEVTRFSTAEMMSKFGGEIKDYAAPEDLNGNNRCTQYGILAAREALQDSGLDITADNRHRIALCFGTCNGGIAEFEKARKLVNLDYDATINFPLFRQGDGIARSLGLKGPVVSDVTACTASGHALSIGYELLAEGTVDAVLAGGSDTLSETVFAGFNCLQSLSPTPCAPFGHPMGISLGEGAAFLILEPLEKAVERGASIYAEVCGYGLEQDAYHITAPHPEGDGIARTVAAALDSAAVKPEDVAYINVHGTGTAANDACELRGLKTALGAAFPQIPVSSSKAYFGHTLGAAAIIEAACSLIAISEGLLPATLQTTDVREGCTEANHVLHKLQPGNPSYFLCCNSAFGGHNSAILFKNRPPGPGVSITRTVPSPPRVGILGISMIHQDKDQEKTRKEVKDYIASYYARRMNTLTQYCIAGIVKALKDAGIEIMKDNARRTGLIFGTMYGASESFGKYLKDIFEKGLTYASPLYFPDTSANTAPGNAAVRIGIGGAGTTLSTGGNEGILAAYTAWKLVRNGSQSLCLAGAAEENSAFSREVDRVLGFDQGKYPITEGSGFIVLGCLEDQAPSNKKHYGEIKGFGFSFGLENYGAAVHQALFNAGLNLKDIDFVLNNDDGLGKKGEEQKKTLNDLFSPRPIQVLTCNGRYGYALSVSSMYHICQAAELLNKHREFRYGLVVSSSYNGGNAALILGKVD